MNDFNTLFIRPSSPALILYPLTSEENACGKLTMSLFTH